jgi:hypothetical protein
LLALALAIFLFLPVPAAAAPAKNEGLLITPLREYITVDAGKTKTGAVTVANLTGTRMAIALSVEQFSVADYSYDYRFKPDKHNWIHLEQTAVELEPGKSRRIPYQITVPDKAAAGGTYFTVFASTQFQGVNGVGGKVQAATVLYITVNGKLAKTSALRRGVVPRVSFGGDIPFRFDAAHTGNTHFFLYASGSIEGMGAKQHSPETTRLLLPDTARTMSGTIPAPLLPGIYEVTYGYRTDGGHTEQQNAHVLYLPVWSLAFPVGIGWLVFLWQRHRRASIRK